MSVDLQNELKFDPIIDTLLEKTREGKLRWQETAEEGTYLAAVKGQRTFAISFKPKDPGGDVRLVVRDVDGKVLLDVVFRNAFPSGFVRPVAWELYELARRIALNLDEKVDETVQLLNQL